MQLLFSKIVRVFLHGHEKKNPGSSPAPNRAQQSHSDRAPSQPTTQVRRHHTWARTCTSVLIKNVQGTSPWTAAPLWGVPTGGTPRVFAEHEPTEQREGRESQGVRTKHGALTSRRVRKCNYPCEKERQLQFHFENQILPYRTGYSPLRPGGRRKDSKIVIGGKNPRTTLSFAVLNPIAKTDKKKQQRAPYL